MSQTPCAECQAIYREVAELLEAARRRQPEPGATIEEILARVEQQLEDRESRVRVHPSHAMLLRRLMEHHRLTGHHVPLPPMRPLPPGALTNPN